MVGIMKRSNLSLLFRLMALGFSISFPLASTAVASNVVATAASDPGLKEWRRLLFYQTTIVGGEKGIVDSPSFYLDPDGKTNPELELAATLRGMQDAKATAPGTTVPLRCAFPARLEYLVRQGLLRRGADSLEPSPEASLEACPDLQTWLGHRQYKSMWLVFSSWYPQNPGSMFGHTMLRFRRTDRESDLLDDAVNYAAYVDTDNSVLYPVKGLTGRFPGRFSMLSYFIKIQEYNNIESRDLWEYELNANQEQMRKILLSLWEVAPHQSGYWYLDENCSWMLLKLLETGDPAWDFSSKIKPWVVPVDTMRAVVGTPGFVRSKSQRISQERTFRAREALLDAESAAKFRDLIHQDPVEAAATVKKIAAQRHADLGAAAAAAAVESRRRLFDAGLEYVDMREPMVSESAAKGPLTPLRDALLLARKEIKSVPDPLPGLSAGDDPVAGHGSSHLAAGYFQTASGEYGLNLSWTPTLHELIAPPTGYADGLEIVLVRVSGRWFAREEKAVISEVVLTRIRSLSGWTSSLPAASWFLDSSYSTKAQCPGQSGAGSAACSSTSLAMGRGVAGRFFGERLTLAAFWTGEAGHARDPRIGQQFFAGTGPAVELWFKSAGDNGKSGGHGIRVDMTSQALRRAYHGGLVETRIKHDLHAGVSVAESWDLRLGAAWDQRRLNEVGVDLGHFF